MISKTGIVSKIKILKLSKSPLIRFSLDDTNCLIAVHSLNFFAEVSNGMRLTITGDFNQRQQFVVRKYCLHSQPEIIIQFEKIASLMNKG
ncbi:hypothetical protein M2139_002025 [Enterococcus sp. PF1-24]|uniref:hypothetical protein n=1 Tax=unclassified Enterococcus TaxID=2608891 RepID=UPI0024763B73|nr:MULTISPECIES: hypothetical protein [unclassified Enterococcus]MDH6365024.1 hypothetical protein [Enterococcus sp. PFB1-1]MDH6402125.1 hypothetical protein [Enterococcus sp. PF1-24]